MVLVSFLQCNIGKFNANTKESTYNLLIFNTTPKTPFCISHSANIRFVLHLYSWSIQVFLEDFAIGTRLAIRLLQWMKRVQYLFSYYTLFPRHSQHIYFCSFDYVVAQCRKSRAFLSKLHVYSLNTIQIVRFESSWKWFQ